MKAQRIKLEQERYRSDFWSFTTELLGYKDVSENPHREFINFIIAPGNFKLILWPRGTFKSTIGSISYPLWRLCQNPNLRVLIDSRTVDRSKTFLSEIKQHIERNAAFKELFGSWKYIPGWRETSFTHPDRDRALKEPSIQTGGIDSPVTGGHYDLIVVDDLQDETNSQTEGQRQRAILHYKTLFPILEPTGQMFVIGTPWSPGDVYDYIQNTEVIERA